jgi:hypothetical protein
MEVSERNTADRDCGHACGVAVEEGIRMTGNGDGSAGCAESPRAEKKRRRHVGGAAEQGGIERPIGAYALRRRLTRRVYKAPAEPIVFQAPNTTHASASPIGFGGALSAV